MSGIELSIRFDGGAGLSSNFNRILTILKETSNVKKIKWQCYGNYEGFLTYPTNLMGFNTDTELFSKVYEEYDKSNNEILESRLSLNWGANLEQKITGTNAANFYGPNRHLLKEYNSLYLNYFKLLPNIKDIIDEKKKILRGENSCVIGILIRNSGNYALANEQPKKKMPSHNEYFDLINSISESNQRYFLCIDNIHDLELYKQLYPNSYFTQIRRSLSPLDKEPHIKTTGSYEDFINSLIEVYLLSACDKLVHCLSNMATTSLILNLDQESFPLL
jgi:hypothetical protein